MNRLRLAWSNVNSSLWFVPTLMVTAASGLAYGLVMLDDNTEHKWLQDYPMLFGAGADGARGMLTAIASSMITVAGLIFSLTLATLAQVSSQYTPRVLRNFMGDRANQLVLGFFVSIFVYCLIVLRTIRGGDEGRFIPSLAVAGGLVLALVSIGVLIFFIHHIASSIQASTIIARAAAETQGALDNLFPEQMGHEATAAEATDWRETDHHWHAILALRSGYVQDVNNDALLDFAREINGVVRMERGIGSFVAKEAPLVSVARYDGQPLSAADEKTRQRLCGTYSIGDLRTIDQDLGFGFRQLVDIALKALSPGINDTTTAIFCVDQLGALLSLLADRKLNEPLRSEGGRVRVVAQIPTFATYAALAFDQIRSAAEGNLSVLLRLLTAIETVARRTRNEDRLAVLQQQADRVREQAEAMLQFDYDKQAVFARYVAVGQTLKAAV
ncbi:DUF2254 domain-containing protein [Hymenobacter sp. B1770]|uniref:DUF2254 domain-containing protein n=1 Tax=Hymenobacter sp. B1770 TaxID=1718788 RepID=UPI003CF0CD69